MTIEIYEKAGGFSRELSIVRQIGERIVTLQEMIPSRPHRPDELEAVGKLNLAINELRTLIARYRY